MSHQALSILHFSVYQAARRLLLSEPLDGLAVRTAAGGKILHRVVEYSVQARVEVTCAWRFPGSPAPARLLAV